MAKETLKILEQGYYFYQEQRVEISQAHQSSVSNSKLFTPEQGASILEKYQKKDGQLTRKEEVCVSNCSTVDAIFSLKEEGKNEIGVLNFASAKNPGGGFLNGAKAQEESLTVSSGLYETLIAHKEYYTKNRECGTMIYTDYVIYSPEVLFFRDGCFELQKVPVSASVLTLPAVNMGQVLLKKEDPKLAEEQMRKRMALSLAIFAHENRKNLILGAYGCGVFRNDPKKVAAWWKELLSNTFHGIFEKIVFAVLDHSTNKGNIQPFKEIFT